MDFGSLSADGIFSLLGQLGFPTSAFEIESFTEHDLLQDVQGNSVVGCIFDLHEMFIGDLL